MKNRLLVTVALCTFLCSSASRAATTILEKDDWKVQMSGFVEADAVNDSTRGFTESIGNAPVTRPGTYNGDNGRTMFSARNSRLGFTILPPVQDDWRSKGVLEFDFLGYLPAVGSGVSESGFYQ